MMLYDFNALTHAGIRSLNPYTPGKSIESLAAEKGLTNIIKLASNENPLGCSQLVQQALSNLSPHDLCRYPCALTHPLRAKLAKQLGINLTSLMLSNG